MIRGCLLVLGTLVSPRAAWDKPRWLHMNRSCRAHPPLAQGEPPRPPAPSEGAVAAVAPISTGAGRHWRCWAQAGGGTAKAAGRCHSSVTTPWRGATRGGSNALGSFPAMRRRREGAHQVSTGHRGRRAGDPVAVRDPVRVEQEGEEHPWVAKRVERVRHLARKMLVATETRHFPSPFWAICVLGRREGLACHVPAQHNLLPFPSRRRLRVPEEATNTSLLSAEALQVVGSPELSKGWDLF